MLEHFLIVIVIILYFYYLWQRRYLYLYSSKVPGPFSLPLIGSVHKSIGDSTVVFKNLLDLIDQYPQLGKVWFGTNLFYVVSKPEYFERILNNQGAFERIKLFKHASVLLGDGLLTAPVPIWRRHRKIIAPTFKSTVLTKFQDSYVENSKILIEKLENLPKNVAIPFFTLMTNCTLDIVSESLFGVKIDAQINNKAYGQLFSQWLDIYFLKCFKVWYHVDLIFRLTKHFKQHQKYLGEILTLAKMIIKKKQKEIEEQVEQTNVNDKKEEQWKPLLEYLLNFEKHDLSSQEIEDEIITFMLAGTDTTATTLCFSMLLLGMHQEIQQKLYDEVVDVLGNDKDVEINDLVHLKLTERVIKETLRLFPPVPFAAREITQDISLGTRENVILPKHSQAFLGYFHVHRNAEYWPEPLKFDPDRFLPEEIEKRHPYSWIPFSNGPRNCIGGKMAIMLVKTVLAMIVRRFKFKTDYKSVEEVELKTNIVIKPKDGYKVSITAR